MMKFLQRLGKSLMLPVACLPVAGILIGIGYWLLPSGETNWLSALAHYMIQAGGAVIDNIPLLFAIGISIGMSCDRNGVSALSGLVSWLVLTSLLSPTCIEMLGMRPDAAFGKTANVLMAIVAGLIGSWSYNRFKDTRLPDALAFFSGKRSVAIVSACISCLAALPLLFIWPLLFNGLISLGTMITKSGAVGAGIYGFFNRLLIPFGLHHALNQVFWFDIAGINDLPDFWSGQGELGVTGQYMSGFFPMMMFGIPAAALAMYHTALPGQKKAAAGILLASALSSFLTGVTEPLEFSFMFLAPGLYLVHALLTGITVGVVAALPVRAGFNFSAGLTDYLLCLKSPMALNPLYLLLIGLAAGVVYYGLFRWLIVRFNLKTIGREEKSAETVGAKDKAPADDFDSQAEKIIAALGGKENIADLDHCISRLRLELVQPELVDDTAIRATGVAGIIHPGGKSLQIVVGTKVQFLADAMHRQWDAAQA